MSVRSRPPVSRATNPAFRVVDAPPSSPDRVEPHVAQIALLAQVLLGAAYADGFYNATEAVAIAEILSQYVDLDPLPGPVQQAMRGFAPDAFDVADACARLHVVSARDRRELLDLVARVTGADQRVGPSEGAYLRRVAEAIGAAPEEYADLLAGTEPPPVPEGDQAR